MEYKIDNTINLKIFGDFGSVKSKSEIADVTVWLMGCLLQWHVPTGGRENTRECNGLAHLAFIPHY